MKNKYTKEDAYKNLEFINSWINNSDTKASIVLGLIGIILTIIFSNSSLINKCVQLMNEFTKKIQFSDILYIAFLLSAITLFLLGLYKLIKVLIPTLKIKHKAQTKSFLYFGDIATYSGSFEFKEELKKAKENEIFDDILNQLYINSTICNNKFNNFTVGLKCSLIGLILFFILFFLGISIYL